MRCEARLALGADDVRSILADTELQKAAAAAVQSRAAELGLVLPPEKAGKLAQAKSLAGKGGAPGGQGPTQRNKCVWKQHVTW